MTTSGRPERCAASLVSPAKGARDDFARMNACPGVTAVPTARASGPTLCEGVYLGHRRLSIIDVGGGAPADVDRRRRARRGLQRRDLQPRRAARGTETRWARFRHRSLRHRGAAARLPRLGRRLRQPPQRHVGVRDLRPPRGRLFCSRDRFGKKPFYYTHRHGTVRFRLGAVGARRLTPASRLASRRGASGSTSPTATSRRRTASTKASTSFPGGHSLALRHRVRRAASVEVLGLRDRAVRAGAGRCRAASGASSCANCWARAVKRRLMSDVPHRLLPERRHRLLCGRRRFAARRTIGPADSTPSASASRKPTLRRVGLRARRAADFIGSHHQRRHALHRQGARGDAADVAAARRADGRQLAAADLSALRVRARAGDGRPRRRRRRRAVRRLRSVPRAALGATSTAGSCRARCTGPSALADRAAAGVAPQHEPGFQGQAHAARARSPTERCGARSGWGRSPRREIAELFGEPVDVEELYSEAIEQWDALPQRSLVDERLQFYTKLYLQDDILVKVDRASMMHSLEVRAPFLDIELVDFVRRIPWQLQVAGRRDQVPAEEGARARAAEGHPLSGEEGLRRADRRVVKIGSSHASSGRTSGNRRRLRRRAPRSTPQRCERRAGVSLVRPRTRGLRRPNRRTPCSQLMRHWRNAMR